jgi:hypothetical protein
MIDGRGCIFAGNQPILNGFVGRVNGGAVIYIYFLDVGIVLVAKSTLEKMKQNCGI